MSYFINRHKHKDSWTLTEPHIYEKHSFTHVSMNTSAQTFDASMCLQEVDSSHRSFFLLAGAETDCSNKAAEVLNQPSRGRTTAVAARLEKMNMRLL